MQPGAVHGAAPGAPSRAAAAGVPGSGRPAHSRAAPLPSGQGDPDAVSACPQMVMSPGTRAMLSLASLLTQE